MSLYHIEKEEIESILKKEVNAEDRKFVSDELEETLVGKGIED
jgi:hypothetical protein